MIRAVAADRAAIMAFLAPHAPFTMFPLNNLVQFGIAGGHDLAVTCWQARDGGRITDVMTVCDNGMALPFLPSGDYAATLRAMADRDVIGIIGPRNHVRGLQAAGFADAPCTLDRDEPHFLLDLDQMVIPDGPGDLRPLGDAPRDAALAWMTAYEVEGLNTPADQATARAAKALATHLARDSHRVLMAGDAPLAMTGFNAQLADIVQVGGVYTPPDLRGQGYARRVVALHLAQAAGQGVTRATLFAGSPAAARAYQAIGFDRIGEWTMLFFDGPQRPVAA